MKPWELYKRTVKKNCSSNDIDINDMAYWRNKLFGQLMVIFIPISIIVIIPGVIIAIIKGPLQLALVDLMVLSIAFFIVFNKSIRIQTRKILFIAVLYFVATAMIYYLGSFGPGLLYLLVITFFCVLLFSDKTAYISVIVNAGICLLFGLTIYLKFAPSSIFVIYGVGSWLAISINLVMLSLVMAVLLPILIDNMQRSNDKFEMMTSATSDTVCEWDIENDIKTYNHGLYDMFGYRNDDIQYTKAWWLSKVHPEDVYDVKSAINDSLVNGTTQLELEYRFKCADGIYKNITYRSFIFRNQNNKAIKTISAIRDITQRKQKDDWLKLTEQIITNATDAVLIVTPSIENEKKAAIIYANDAYSKMTGYSKEDLADLDIDCLCGPLSDLKESERLKTTVKSGNVYSGEQLNYKKNGDTFWNNKTVSPIKDDTGKIIYYISIERDVTERNNYVRAIENQNKKLKEISWKQSHIVRGPLTRIMGLITLLTNSATGTASTNDIIGYIETSANELDHVVRDIIKNAEIEMANEPSLPTPISDL